MAEQWQLDAIRAKIGSEEASDLDDGYVEDLIDSLGSVEAAALRVLEQRLADLLNESPQLSVTGFSKNDTKLIDSLEKQIEALGGAVSLSGDVVTTVDAVRLDVGGR